MDKGPLTGVRHDLVEIELVDDHNTSAELGFGMLRVFTTTTSTRGGYEPESGRPSAVNFDRHPGEIRR
jgi:hypothetical protein